jgi:hypothetical protein
VIRPRFIRWRRGDRSDWIGADAAGVDRFQITRRFASRTARAGRRITYLRRNLDRPNESVETCRHAKAYAQELARLWGFPAF